MTFAPESRTTVTSLAWRLVADVGLAILLLLVGVAMAGIARSFAHEAVPAALFGLALVVAVQPAVWSGGTFGQRLAAGGAGLGVALAAELFVPPLSVPLAIALAAGGGLAVAVRALR